MSKNQKGKTEPRPAADGEIRACVFDTFGTLLDWRTSVARQVKAVADAKGVEGDWTPPEPKPFG